MCDGTSVQDPCWKKVTKPEFVYYGSCLGGFTVKNAVLWECDRCGSITLLASICKDWEAQKAVEIIENSNVFTGIEIRFIRELCRKTHVEFALELDIARSDYLLLEVGAGITSAVCRMIARHFLRQGNHLDGLHPLRQARIREKVHMETED